MMSMNFQVHRGGGRAHVCSRITFRLLTECQMAFSDNKCQAVHIRSIFIQNDIIAKNMAI